ncbi:MAG TPA: hypothetical protein VGH33_25835 [Isosphaeraceae bacterium]|jgi:hypothetical protein
MPLRSWALFAGLLFAAGIPPGRREDSHDKLPPAASVLLDEADAVELISLEPRDRPANSEESFHGWKVLGRGDLRDPASRRAIITSVKRGIGAADKVAGCFEPRHGLRATKGDRSADLVICFSCGWIEVHSEGKTSSVWTSDSPKEAFNKALRDAGATLAQDVEGP